VSGSLEQQMLPGHCMVTAKTRLAGGREDSLSLVAAVSSQRYCPAAIGGAGAGIGGEGRGEISAAGASMGIAGLLVRGWTQSLCARPARSYERYVGVGGRFPRCRASWHMPASALVWDTDGVKVCPGSCWE